VVRGELAAAPRDLKPHDGVERRPALFCDLQGAVEAMPAGEMSEFREPP
jgi:hypothetical protein